MVTTPVNIELKVIAREIRQEKRNKSHPNIKEVKLSLFAFEFQFEMSWRVCSSLSFKGRGLESFEGTLYSHC